MNDFEKVISIALISLLMFLGLVICSIVYHNQKMEERGYVYRQEWVKMEAICSEIKDSSQS